MIILKKSKRMWSNRKTREKARIEKYGKYKMLKFFRGSYGSKHGG